MNGTKSKLSMDVDAFGYFIWAEFITFTPYMYVFFQWSNSDIQMEKIRKLCKQFRLHCKKYCIVLPYASDSV